MTKYPAKKLKYFYLCGGVCAIVVLCFLYCQSILHAQADNKENQTANPAAIDSQPTANQPENKSNAVIKTATPITIEKTGAESRLKSKQALSFNRDIRPILSENCFTCHGTDKAARKADLRMDKREVAVELGAIVPGKPDESEMIARINSKETGEGGIMPPVDSHKTLTAKQRETLRRWITEGAEYEPHWAFILPKRSSIPNVKQKQWIRNEIDSFILSRLEQAGLSPADEADKYTLIRRLSLDLIGLPPTIKEADDFVNDHSPDAYDKLVERLLVSPHYGERWGLWWLDIAHYADTNGYEVDRPRTIWPYRDWVINALNNNMPYSQFVIEQIAGDMLPNATLDQRVATGFLRNTFYNEEGGHDPEQFRWESIIDRVNTTSTAFLGLTMACCQCHDHKYDPITNREFYQYFAFLNNGDEPELDIPQENITAEREKIQTKIARLQTAIEESKIAHDDKKFEEWCVAQAKEARNWVVLEPIRFKSKADADMTKLEDNSLLVTGDRPEVDIYDVVYRSPVADITGVKLEAIPDERLPYYGPGRGYFRGDGTFALSEFSVRVGSDPDIQKNKLVKLINPSATFAHKSDTIDKALDGNKLTGWHSNGDKALRVAAVFPTQEPLKISAGDELTVSLMHNFPHAQLLGRFRMWATSDSAPLKANLMTADVEQALLKPASEWSTIETEAVKKYYLSVTPELKKQNEEISKLRKSMPTQPRGMVMVERTRKRNSHIHTRGEYTRPEAEVLEPNVPSVLPPLDKDVPRNRLTLAKWFVDEKNPIVRRVLVNQIWQCYFGRGLVNTPENFGSQGDPPSHPELLDWLACEVLDSGWDLKQLHRKIAKSAAYRQSSVTSPEKLEKDPENILLSRGPRFRVTGETVRDIALMASGLLSHKIGGPSVFPPQPAGLEKEVYNGAKWTDSKGEDRYRRGIYTHRKRSQMYPAFMVFDEPQQNLCTMRRIRSNTPLAALNMLNDEAMIEAAQVLALHVLENNAASNDDERLKFAFRLCATRFPKETELTTLREYVDEQKKLFAADEKSAATVAGVDEKEKSKIANLTDRAAWTMLSRVLLNLDETITKE